MFLKIDNRVLRGAALSAALLAGACGGGSEDKSKSQVIAKVDGVEVTYSELAHEIETNTRPGMTVDDAQRSQLLDQLIQRKLLIAQATEQRIDKRPDFLSAAQRQREMMLASMLVRDWQKEVKQPNEQDVTKYIAAHPERFGERRVVILDRLTVNAKMPVERADLEAAPNLKEMAELLVGAGQRPDVQRLQLDSAQAAGQLLKQVREAKPGKPMIETVGDKLIAVQILAVQPAPVPEDQRAQAARQMMMGEQLNKMVEQRVKDARAKAKIEYSAGYSAPKPQPSEAPAAAKK